MRWRSSFLEFHRNHHIASVLNVGLKEGMSAGVRRNCLPIGDGIIVWLNLRRTGTPGANRIFNAMSWKFITNQVMTVDVLLFRSIRVSVAIRGLKKVSFDS